ncbi:MAG: 2-amino-4-hydroxy-6-hydroxymethyldihydropteridine diphosphokinase [Fluviicola sp.]|nr:2-amino-4-hydroxy-6-hydroxymethyldihydropteridine diphosphokinase [Fluviicola sp.]
MEVNTIILSLGSDLGDKIAHLEQAITKIRENIGEIVSISSVYESEPVGFVSDTTFFNLCLIVDSTLTKEEILPELQRIEKEIGRKKKENQPNYESRIIDLDIIFFNAEIIRTKELSVPHLHFRERKFVLIPLVEIVPDFIDPISHLNCTQLLKNCSDNSKVSKIESDFQLKE